MTVPDAGAVAELARRSRVSIPVVVHIPEGAEVDPERIVALARSLDPDNPFIMARTYTPSEPIVSNEPTLSPVAQIISDRLVTLFRPEDIERILNPVPGHPERTVATPDQFADQLARELAAAIEPYLRPGAESGVTTESHIPAYDATAPAMIPTGSDGHVHYGLFQDAHVLCGAFADRIVATTDWTMVDCKVCRWRGEDDHRTEAQRRNAGECTHERYTETTALAAPERPFRCRDCPATWTEPRSAMVEGKTVPQAASEQAERPAE